MIDQSKIGNWKSKIGLRADKVIKWFWIRIPDCQSWIADASIEFIGGSGVEGETESR
jgi:hypothetical protein